MSSVVDICNLALSHLGDTATIASIDPPEGSAQAEHCARFYPIARNALLEMHTWEFATERKALAQLNLTVNGWDYVYAEPNNVINAIAVIAPDNTDDYSVKSTQPSQYGFNPEIIPAAGYYVPQPFVTEIVNGTPCILTDQKDAVFRYTSAIIDSSRFSPLFVVCLSWYLSSMLAGSIIKGDVGAAEGKRCLQMFQAHFAEATVSDSNQRQVRPYQNVPWLSGR